MTASTRAILLLFERCGVAGLGVVSTILATALLACTYTANKVVALMAEKHADVTWHPQRLHMTEDQDHQSQYVVFPTKPTACYLLWHMNYVMQDLKADRLNKIVVHTDRSQLRGLRKYVTTIILAGFFNLVSKDTGAAACMGPSHSDTHWSQY